MQYYIIRSDELWQEIEPVLIQKAKEGVEVRVLLTVWAAEQCIKKDWKPAERRAVYRSQSFSRRCLESCSFV
mgnify:CR=1 FL=1